MSGKGTIITAADYNALIGENPTTDLNTFNAVWATGSGKFGYGQAPISKLVDPSIAIDDRIKLNAWTNLVTAVNTAKTHLGISTSVISIPSQVSAAPAGIIFADSLDKLTQSIKDIYANHLNVAAQGDGTDYKVVNSSTWRDAIAFTYIVTFANGDAARYFFNLGGQFKLTFGAAPGFRINAIMNRLAQVAGTLVISSPSVETINIVGTDYKGVTNIKTPNVEPTAVPKEFTGERYGVITYNDLSSSIGYYGMTTSDQVIFRQSVGSVPATELRYNYYDGSYIQVSVKTNGPQGVNGDNGNVITIKVLWDQVPNGLQVYAGTNTTLTIRPPLVTSGMTQSWGTPVVNGTVSGS